MEVVANVIPCAGEITHDVVADENLENNRPFPKSVSELRWTFSQFAAGFPVRGYFDIREVDAGLEAYCPQSFVVLALPPNADGGPAPFNLTHPICTAPRESFAACSGARQYLE